MSAKRYPSVIMATCCVPWNVNYQLDEGQFRRLIQHTVTELTPHVYIFGTAGEGYAVNEQQFDNIVRIFHDETTQLQAHPTVGLISLSLSTVQARIERCIDLGIDSFQISLPAWGECTPSEIDVFFQQTCGKYPQCRFTHYNVRRSKNFLSGQDYARLATAHANLVAVKTGLSPDGDLKSIVTGIADLQFFVTEANYASLRDEQELGFLVSMASINASLAKRFFAVRGTELTDLSLKFGQLHSELIRIMGDAPRQAGAYDKLFCRFVSPEFPLRLLPPYTGATEKQWQEFNAAVSTIFP